VIKRGDGLLDIVVAGFFVSRFVIGCTWGRKNGSGKFPRAAARLNSAQWPRPRIAGGQSKWPTGLSDIFVGRLLTPNIFFFFFGGTGSFGKKKEGAND